MITESQRIERLEALVCVLARALLVPEYPKDAARERIYEICRELADSNLHSAFTISQHTTWEEL